MNKIYFTYKGSNTRLKQITNKLNALFNSDNFHYRIATKEGGYLWSTCSGSQISETIRSCPKVAEIRLKKSKNPFSAALAYYYASEPDVVYLNSRKLNRTEGSIAASCTHEKIHQVDDWIKTESFGHKSNKKTPEKEDTAPYHIDNIAESMISNIPIEMIDDRTKNKHIKYVPVWYKRIFMPWTWF